MTKQPLSPGSGKTTDSAPDDPAIEQDRDDSAEQNRSIDLPAPEATAETPKPTVIAEAGEAKAETPESTGIAGASDPAAAPSEAPAPAAESAADSPVEAQTADSPVDAQAADSPVEAPTADTPVEAPAADFAKALEDFERGKEAAAASAAVELKVGALVSGKIVSIGDEHALLDIGGRSEAAAEIKHFRKADGSLSVTVGDSVDLYVVQAGEDVVLAPTMRTDRSAAIAQLREAKEARIPIKGRVTAVNSGGLSVNLGGVRGFCPMSQVESGYCEDASAYVGQTLDFLVTEVKGGRAGVVVSRKHLLRRAEKENARKVLETLSVGDEHDATVVRLEAFGAFVNMGGIDGLVHVSEIGHARVGHPKDALRKGEKVRVRVLKITKGKDGKPRIALSIKAAQPDPWEGVEQRYTEKSKIEGEVVRITDFGTFVSLEPGIDGLIHVSESAPKRVTHPKDVFTVGQRVEAIVLKVDAEKKRISLSVRALSPESEIEAPRPDSKPSGREGRGAREAREGRGGREGRAGRGKRDGRAGRDGRRSGDGGGHEQYMQQTQRDDEPTTMALALRKAMEKAKKKEQSGS